MAIAIDRNERAARNQSLFREVNERVVALEQGGLQEVAGDGSVVHAICECANAACHEPIVMDIEAYMAIRSSPLRFPIKPGHEWPDVERVFSEHDGYIVVEKLGETGEMATELAGESAEAQGGVTHPTAFDGPWRAENAETLRTLASSLKERVKAGDLNARLPLQVVVVVHRGARRTQGSRSLGRLGQRGLALALPA